MPLTPVQLAEIEGLATAGKMGGLNELAAGWGVEFREVARAYADAQRKLSPPGGAPEPPKPAVPDQVVHELTAQQRDAIRRLAATGGQAKLVPLAVTWCIPHRVLARLYSDYRAEIGGTTTPPAETTAVTAVIYDRTRWAELSPVANVTAPAGAIGVIPRNWPLIDAKIRSGKSLRDIAFAAGITTAEYVRIEEGRQLPTPDQAARVCAYLNLPLEQTFAVAGQEQMAGRGGIRGLSFLGLLRARKRLSMRNLAQAASADGVRVTEVTVSAIERDKLQRPLSADQQKQLRALAVYLEISEEWVTAQVPPTWIQTVANNTAQLHAAMQATYAQLPLAVGAGDPERFLAAPKEGVVGGA